MTGTGAERGAMAGRARRADGSVTAGARPVPGTTGRRAEAAA